MRPIVLPRFLAGIAGAGLCMAGQSAAALPTAAVPVSGADMAWMLIATVLVLLMTMPGIILFYSGMLRAKNALSIAAHTVAATAVVTLVWAVAGYSIAFTPGTPLAGDLSRLFAAGLGGASVATHPLAPTIPEPLFFLFQMAFAVIAFALILGATAERMRLGAMAVFASLWTLLVYAPVAHWVWQPGGWLVARGHMDFAGGTVVHAVAGASGLAAAALLGRRQGFGREPMMPHNLLLTVMGAGLLWVGWFGFNAGSAFEAGTRAGGALLNTQVAACVGAVLWSLCDHLRRGQWSVLGMMTGAIAGLVAVTPASGFVGVSGALAIGAIAGVTCYLSVAYIKPRLGIDDPLDVFALHGVGGLLGTALTPLFASSAVAPVTSSPQANALGALAAMVYAGVVTWALLKLLALVMPLRVSPSDEKVGLDMAQHGEMLAPSA
ncbi:MAG TPA: ammonium transporter [Burkholderiaceae bacterium]|nr:ammonium transporter [Burkholderiaceae bacterium]